MNNIKKYFGSVFVLLIACLSVGLYVKASSPVSTEVQIAIEASEVSGETRNVENTQDSESSKGVQTGDNKNVWRYLLAMGTAVFVGVAFFLRRK